MQGILELDIVSGSGVGHGTPDFEALSERSNYRKDSQSTVAGPPSCASVALRRRLGYGAMHSKGPTADMFTHSARWFFFAIQVCAAQVFAIMTLGPCLVGLTPSCILYSCISYK